MADFHVVIWNGGTLRLEIPDIGDRYIMEQELFLDGNFTLSGTLNGIDVITELPKLTQITVTGPVDLDALKAKSDHLTVTQAVDLDVMETRLNELDAAVVLKGAWDASTLVFPTSTKAGESWICSVAGIVDGIDFAEGDRVVALVDNAPGAYAGNWLKLDYTDKVSSVAGKTGNVVLVESDITDLQNYLLPVDIDSIAKLNLLVGDTVLTASLIDTLGELNTIITDATLIDTNDPRLSDARTPLAHTHSESEISDLGNYLTAADLDSLAELEAIVGVKFVIVGKRSRNPNVTAYAGGGQSNATQLLVGTTLVETVASPGDSVKLPAAAEGNHVVIVNDGNFNMDVYPNTSDKIDAAAIDIPVSIPPSGVLELLALDEERWITR